MYFAATYCITIANLTAMKDFNKTTVLWIFLSFLSVDKIIETWFSDFICVSGYELKEGVYWSEYSGNPFFCEEYQFGNKYFQKDTLQFFEVACYDWVPETDKREEFTTYSFTCNYDFWKGRKEVIFIPRNGQKLEMAVPVDDYKAIGMTGTQTSYEENDKNCIFSILGAVTDTSNFMRLSPDPIHRFGADPGTSWTFEKTHYFTNKRYFSHMPDSIRAIITYNVVSDETLQTAWGSLLCDVTNASSTTSLDNFKLKSYFHPDIGFVKLDFEMDKGRRIILTRVKNKIKLW